MRIECALCTAFTLNWNSICPRMADWSRAITCCIMRIIQYCVLQQRLKSRIHTLPIANQQELLKMTDRVVFRKPSCSSACINSLLMTSGIAYASFGSMLHWIPQYWSGLTRFALNPHLSWCASDKASVWTRPIRIRCASNSLKFASVNRP